MRKLPLALLLAFACIGSYAQAPKFGKITPEDLKLAAYTIDSTAEAVVISDYGTARIEGNSKGWFSIVYKRHRRMHILKKSGYRHADIAIDLFNVGQDEEKLDKLNAVTYNLENGQVVETKLGKDAVFKEKKNRNWNTRKFTFPNVKEGSIIEYEYQVTSDFIHNFPSWSFQDEIPVIWSEYHATIPQFLYYFTQAQGFTNYVKDEKSQVAAFVIVEPGGATRSETYRFNAGITDYSWIMRQVPALKVESFATTPKNYITKLEFKLAAYRPPLTYRNLIKTWVETTKQLMEEDGFGKELKEANRWLGDVMKDVVQGASTEEEKARKIFAYVRDNFTCTSHNDIYVDESLKTVFKNRSGGVAEINMLLTAMLRYAGIAAEPVLLSTRDHGYVNETYPNLNDYNYIISKAVINGKPYTLDASYARLGFGKLPQECYNGTGRIMNEQAELLALHPDSLREREVSYIVMVNDDKGRWTGAAKQLEGYFGSYSIRNKVKEKGKEGFFKDIQKSFGTDITISNASIDSLGIYEEPVQLAFDFTVNKDDEDIIYINPMFGEGYKENPFKSEERLYPVEMPYVIDDVYLLSMEVPAGYVVDELPKPMIVKLNDKDDATFEYRVTHSGNTISLHSKLKFKRALFAPEEYEMLRGFFSYVVAKHNEQIVFKKKK